MVDMVIPPVMMTDVGLLLAVAAPHQSRKSESYCLYYSVVQAVTFLGSASFLLYNGSPMRRRYERLKYLLDHDNVV